MFMEHTDRMVFTKEDADLLERYLTLLGDVLTEPS